MMSMMCGGCGDLGNRRAARRMRHGNNTQSPTNHHHHHHQQQHHPADAAVFREEQADLLDVFQRHQFDLLAGNPPSHNPDFVGNPPSQNPGFVARHCGSNERPSVFDDAFAALDAEEAAGHRRQGSNNPFEDDGVAPSNPFEASVLGSSHEYFSQNRVGVAPSQNFVGVAPVTAATVPMASAVAISDDDDSELEIPFVSALRIDDEEMEAPHSTRSAPVPVTSPAAHFGPASRVAHPEVQQPRRFSDSQMRPNQIPTWLDVDRVATNQRRGSSANANPACHARHSRCGNKRPGNWSRLSVQARAAAEETRRSFKKKVGREAKQVKKSLAKEANSVRKSLTKDMRQLSRSMREVEEMMTFRCHRR